MDWAMTDFRIDCASIYPCLSSTRCDADSGICLCQLGFVGDPDLFCMPPVGPAVCSPGCGPNSHCEYGAPNKCVCDPGFNGSPLAGCQSSAVTETCSR